MISDFGCYYVYLITRQSGGAIPVLTDADITSKSTPNLLRFLYEQNSEIVSLFCRVNSR